MRKKLAFIFLSLFICTGCWDQVEIEQRGFVIGAGIDETEEGKILLTQQIINPAGMQQQEGSGGGGSSQAYLNVEQSGDSIFEIVRGVATKTSRTPYYGHVQAFVFSSSVAKTRGIEELLDFYIRDFELRRNALLLISHEDAKSIMDVAPKNEKTPTMYIQSISENNYKNAEILPKTRIGDVHERLLGKESFPITMIEKRQDELDLSGVAIIDGNSSKMVGTLDRDGTVGLNLITNEIQGGFIKAYDNGEPFLYDIFKSKTSISAKADDINNISFKIDVEMEGGLGETHFTKDFLKEQTLNDLETLLEEEITTKIETVLQKSQEFGVDFLGFLNHLRTDHYKVWKQIHNEWESGKNYYEKVNFTTDVNVMIRSTGTINQM